MPAVAALLHPDEQRRGCREFDRAWDEGGLFLLTMHPHVIGYRSRIFILEELIAHMKAQGGCWFATHADVARHCRAESVHS